MSSHGACPRCSSPLSKYLVNVQGDFMLNCPKPSCLYGLLDAKIMKSNGTICSTLMDTSAVAISNEIESFFDTPISSPLMPKPTPSVISNPEIVSSDPADVYNIESPFNVQTDPSADIANWLEEMVSGPPLPPPSSSEEVQIDSTLPVAFASGVSSEVIPFFEGHPPLKQSQHSSGKTKVSTGCVPMALKKAVTLQCGRNTGRQRASVATKSRVKVDTADLLRARAVNISKCDDAKSVGSEDSGIGSDDLSTLSPIQRQLKMLQAKKKANGISHLPGLSPSLISLFPGKSSTSRSRRKAPRL